MDMSIVIETIIGLLAAVVSAVVIPYIKAKTTEQQRTQIMEWVCVAVQAVEQNPPDSNRGADKKTYVLAFLRKMGCNMSDDELDAMIEAAVYKMKQGVLGA